MKSYTLEKFVLTELIRGRAGARDTSLNLVV